MRLLAIQNARSKKVREDAYKDMLRYAYKVCVYGESAVTTLLDYKGGEEVLDVIRARNLAEKIAEAIHLLRKVMDKTERRVLRGESVPASEKVVSLFKEHTDIIVKGNRKTEYGHKLFLTGGVSNLIIDCMIKRGNPADPECFQELFNRQEDYYGRPPRQTTADGGFASKNNLAYAKRTVSRTLSFPKREACQSWVWPRVPGCIRG